MTNKTKQRHKTDLKENSDALVLVVFVGDWTRVFGYLVATADTDTTAPDAHVAAAGSYAAAASPYATVPHPHAGPLTQPHPHAGPERVKQERRRMIVVWSSESV